MGAGNYTFLGPPIHKNKWVDAEQQAVSGYEYMVRDGVTGATVPIFIPDASYGKEQADTLIMHELQKIRDVHTLGSS